VFANGPDGKPLAGVTFRMDMAVNGTVQDFGSLSARTIVTGTDGVARVIYTSPPANPSGNTGTCSNGLPGQCVNIVATATGTNFVTANPETVLIRLVPLGVILPPASTPTPCFTLSPTAPAANSPVQFTAGTAVTVGTTTTCGLASSDITSFDWNFGDGSTASGKNVTHTFGSANTFNVTLTETNDRSVAASVTLPVTVSSSAGSAPTATFTVSPSAPAVNQTVFFNASTSAGGAGHTITSYRWAFGDGTTATGVTTTHAYAAAGTYTVQLTVTDDTGQSTTSLGTPVTVTSGAGSTPTATFTFSPAAPAVGETVFFNASTSTAGPGRTIASYLWTFGDGATSTGVTTTHAYSTAGSYSVQLKVTDDAGVSTTSTATSIIVGNPPAPTAGFTFSPVAPVVNQQIIFDASSSTTAQGQSIVDVAWNFGDNTPVIHCPGGSSADCPGPTNRISTHTYTIANTYVVNLVVTDSAGRIASTNRTVQVFTGNPEPVITFSPSTAAHPGTIGFSSAGTRTFSGATITSYSWDFGDPTSGPLNSSSAANPSHTYLNAGTYTVRLTVTDSQGRVGQTTVTVTIS
jgi:PKD repeat protein